MLRWNGPVENRLHSKKESGVVKLPHGLVRSSGANQRGVLGLPDITACRQKRRR
jgi:hypothetical protein